MTMGKLRALLVDDSSDDRFFMRMVLERNDKFIVEGEVCDGQEAMDYLKQARRLPDIVLLDLKMPGKNGFDVLEWIQTANLGDLVIAVLSGSWLAEEIGSASG